jgi:hypothetical protein
LPIYSSLAGGAVVYVKCPHNCGDLSNEESIVYGNPMMYTDSSSVCKAAVQMNALQMT